MLWLSIANSKNNKVAKWLALSKGEQGEHRRRKNRRTTTKKVLDEKLKNFVCCGGQNYSMIYFGCLFPSVFPFFCEVYIAVVDKGCQVLSLLVLLLKLPVEVKKFLASLLGSTRWGGVESVVCSTLRLGLGSVEFCERSSQGRAPEGQV